jgi:hypothetical protein
MKSIFRSLSMVALVAAFAVTGSYAQNVCDDLDTPTAKYTTFTENYQKKTEAEVTSAIAAGKEFLEKWGNCEGWKEQVAFVKPWIPRLEKTLEGIKDGPMFEAFDKAVIADNIDGIYTNGKQIIAKYPQNHDVKYVMAVAALADVSKAVLAKTQSKYAGEAAGYAKTLYDGIKSGSIASVRKLKDGTPSYGVLKHETTKEEALSRLAYTQGFINYYALNNKKSGVATYYEVSQLPGYFKGYAPVYVTISDYYRDEAANIVKESATKTSEYNALVEEVKKLDANAPGAKEKAEQLAVQIEAKDKEIKAKDALIKGYIERAMDALARAHKVAKDGTPAEKQYKEALYKDLQNLYKQRFEKEAGLNEWVAATTAKPFPDPTSTVQPVVEETTTTTTTTSTTGTGAANGTGVGAANGTGVGAANGSGVAPRAGVAVKKP